MGTSFFDAFWGEGLTTLGFVGSKIAGCSLECRGIVRIALC